MFLLVKPRDHKFQRNGDINSYINSYMETLEKAELTTSICHIGRFLKSGIPIYNSKVPDMANRKTAEEEQEQRQLHSIMFHANTINYIHLVCSH